MVLLKPPTYKESSRLLAVVGEDGVDTELEGPSKCRIIDDLKLYPWMDGLARIQGLLMYFPELNSGFRMTTRSIRNLRDILGKFERGAERQELARNINKMKPNNR